MKKQTISILIGLAVLVSMLLACGGSSIPTPTTTPQELAWYACKSFIDDQLGISSLDAQEYNPGRVLTLPENKFEVTVFYAKYTSTYQCLILHRADSKWQLLDLSLIRE